MPDFFILSGFCSHKLYLQHGGSYDNEVDDVTAPRVFKAGI